MAATLNPFRLVIDEIYERYLIGYGLVTRGAATLKAVALIAYAACLAAAAAHKEIDRGTLQAIFSQASRFIPESELRRAFFTD